MDILYIKEYLRVFTKLFTGARASEDFQFRLSGSRNNRNTQPQLQGVILWGQEFHNKNFDKVITYLVQLSNISLSPASFKPVHMQRFSSSKLPPWFEIDVTMSSFTVQLSRLSFFSWLLGQWSRISASCSGVASLADRSKYCRWSTGLIVAFTVRSLDLGNEMVT